MIGIAAASPSGQNVRPSMFSARYFRLSMSFATPPPARNTPATALVLIKLGHPQGESDDAHLVVEHDDTAGAEHGAGLEYLVEIHPDINFIGSENLYRCS